MSDLIIDSFAGGGGASTGIAQGFPEDYIIDPMFNGKPLTKTAHIRMCSNSVCPQLAEALVKANVNMASDAKAMTVSRKAVG